jgi:large subunit ribosomal protein L4e
VFTFTVEGFVSVLNVESEGAEVGNDAIPLPDVLKACIRTDIVNFVHGNMAKNKRQPYAVSKKAAH